MTTAWRQFENILLGNEQNGCRDGGGAPLPSMAIIGADSHPSFFQWRLHVSQPVPRLSVFKMFKMLITRHKERESNQ